MPLLFPPPLSLWGRECLGRSFPAALEEIAADASIREVILSGGDPLTLSDRRLREFSDVLAGIAHVERLRLHTRLPVVLPERIDTGLIDWLRSLSVPVVIVIHANHPNELDETVATGLGLLRAEGATLLNQSVLLKGVNDNPGALIALSEHLFALGVLPYYLHQLDRVEGRLILRSRMPRPDNSMTSCAIACPAILSRVWFVKWKARRPSNRSDPAPR